MKRFSIFQITLQKFFCPFQCHKTSHHFAMNQFQNNPPVIKTKSHPRSKFTPEEDNILKQLVNVIGTNDWQSIARHMKGRNSRQCRDRWQNYLSPDVVNGPWTDEEEELLVQKYNEFGPSWKLIATFFPTRTDINIKSRWHLRERRIKKKELQIKKALLKRPLKKAVKITALRNLQTQNTVVNEQIFNQLRLSNFIQQQARLMNSKKIEIKTEHIPLFENNKLDSSKYFEDDDDETFNSYFECWDSLLMNNENSLADEQSLENLF